jgi:preprotein translocase subunit YajC
LLWRPQQKERKRQAEWLSGIKKGDEVVTQSGIIGTVVLVEDRSVTLDVGSGTKMRVLKSTVTSAWKQAEPAKAEAKK